MLPAVFCEQSFYYFKRFISSFNIIIETDRFYYNKAIFLLGIYVANEIDNSADVTQHLNVLHKWA